MKALKTTAVMLALALVASAPVRAQEHDHRDGDGAGHGDMRRDEPRHDEPHQDARPPAPSPRPAVRARQARGAGPEHNFRRGGRLPDQYRDQRYDVSDWRSHHLSAPPRGYQWVQTGTDFVLVAVATGIISSILLSR